jgi:outer membrane protein TolC
LTTNVNVKAGNNPRSAWATLLAGILLSAPSLLPAQVSLATVVDLAQRNSNSVRMAEADVRKAQAAFDETRFAYLPSLNFGSGLPAFPEVGFRGGVPSILSGNVQALTFSVPQNEYISAARAGFRAASLNLKDAREQAALDASLVYIELDIVHRNLDATGQQEQMAARLVDIEQQRSEAGVDPLSDLLQAQLTAAQLKLHRIQLESRAGLLAKQLSQTTGLPVGALTPDRSTIPEIPQIRADAPPQRVLGVQSALLLARSKQQMARGDSRYELIPQISFNALYSRSTRLLNDADKYFARPIPTTNFSSGFSIQVPLFDLGHRAKAKESAADALRAKVEAEQAERQNELHIAELTGSLRELDALAEIASLKQQIANQQIAAVQAQLELGNGAAPGAQAQLSPKAEQLAHIDERQKFQDALDASLELSKARLGLLRALGHMEDWLQELHAK